MVAARELDDFSLKAILKDTDHILRETPFRKSGSGQDVAAGRYIVDQMTRAGLEARLEEFETFDSDPGEARFAVVTPERREIPARACAHIEATPPGGTEAELIDVGAGGEADYEGKDVRGKVVLAAVSYAPATPEKARIAASKGAAGIVLMNWGKPSQPEIPWRGLKSVWGNPTPETWNDIPRLFGLSVSRASGEYLQGLCRQGRVTVRAGVTAMRQWRVLSQPIGWLHAPESAPERDQFIVVSGHIDSWLPGVTDNITGNAVMIELGRALMAERDRLRRSVVFCFWNGHEVAEAAGSAYFVDKHWEAINRSAVAYTNIDSVGMSGATEFHINAAPELAAFSEAIARRALPGTTPIRVGRVDRFGDQSFFGVGVSSSTARHGFPREVVAEQNGATIGWWNHTEQDTMARVDPATLALDTRYWLDFVRALATARVLPHRFGPRMADLQERFSKMLAGRPDPADLAKIPPLLEALHAQVRRFDDHLDALALDPEASDAACERANRTLLRLARSITFISTAACGKYGQDSYGISTLAQPIPMLAALLDYERADPSGTEAKLLTTKLMRLRQKITDGLYQALLALAE